MGFLVRPVWRTTHRMLRRNAEKFFLLSTQSPQYKKNCFFHHDYYSPRPTALTRLRDTIKTGTIKLAILATPSPHKRQGHR